MDIDPEENQESSPAGDEPMQPQPDEERELTNAPEGGEPSQDDALAEMRRTLREEEDERKTRSSKGLRGFFQRLFHRRKSQEEDEAEAASRLDELQFPEPPAERMVKPAAADAAQAEPPAEAKPDFGTLVRSRLTEAFPEPEARETTPEMQQPLVQEDTPLETPPGHSILTSLREPEEEQETPASMREAALEDYVAEPEPAEEASGPLTGNLRRSWRYMRPLEKRLLIGVMVILGLALVAAGGYAAYISIPTPTPVATPTPGLTPLPTSIRLPGDIVYPLSIGYVDLNTGKWNPKGPEWLNGTEICRWVSLPWNEQREAIIRTFKADDEITLSLTQNESIVYKVKSIEKVSDISQLKCGPGSDPVPGLLLMLSQEKSSDRWVVTARP